MTSFIDNLKRENKFQEKLQYDDGAFYYFFSALTVLILVPLSFSVLYNYFRKKPFEFNKENIPKISGKNINHLLKKKEKDSKLNKNLFYKILLAAFLVFLYVQMVSKSDSKEIKEFDPYDILEIDRENFDLDTAKKNFRQLSRKYHPDRNPDDPEAAVKFQLLTKAMDCLSDEKTRENCDKFGNPEGTGGFSVGIALPSFLLDKENKIAVLVIFFIFLLIVIPYFVLSWYSEVSKYDMDGVLIEDKKIFTVHLNENYLNKHCPRTLAMCFEFTNILSTSASQNKDMITIHKELIDNIGKPQIDPKFFKPHHLIHAYMIGYNIGDSLLPDLLMILQTSPKILESMSKFSIFVPGIQTPNGVKIFGLRCALNVIEFGQHFLQGLWFGDSPLLQIEGIDKSVIEALTKKKKKLPEFSKLVKSETKKEDLGFLSPESIDIAVRDLGLFPNIEVKHEVFVEDQTDMRVGDFATLKVTLKRINYKKTDNSDFTYMKSKNFPFNEKEKWYMMVVNEKNAIIEADVANFGKETYEKKFHFPLIEAREYNIRLVIRPNCYVDLNHEEEIKFTVLPKEQNKKYEISEDDKRALNEPSLYEMMTKGIINKDNDSDDELEEGVEEEKNNDEIDTNRQSNISTDKPKSE